MKGQQTKGKKVAEAAKPNTPKDKGQQVQLALAPKVDGRAIGTMLAGGGLPAVSLQIGSKGTPAPNHPTRQLIDISAEEIDRLSKDRQDLENAGRGVMPTQSVGEFEVPKSDAGRSVFMGQPEEKVGGTKESSRVDESKEVDQVKEDNEIEVNPACPPIHHSQEGRSSPNDLAHYFTVYKGDGVVTYQWGAFNPNIETKNYYDQFITRACKYLNHFGYRLKYTTGADGGALQFDSHHREQFLKMEDHINCLEEEIATLNQLLAESRANAAAVQDDDSGSTTLSGAPSVGLEESSDDANEKSVEELMAKKLKIKSQTKRPKTPPPEPKVVKKSVTRSTDKKYKVNITLVPKKKERPYVLTFLTDHEIWNSDKEDELIAAAIDKLKNAKGKPYFAFQFTHKVKEPVVDTNRYN